MRADAARPARPRVLLVDDDASSRRFVALALSRLEIELVACDGVAQALQRLRDDGPAALLLTDLTMPGETGIDLLRRLARDPALRGDARVVVLSAALDAPLAAALRAEGAWRTLAKPASARQLVACVRAALGGAAGALPPRRTAAAADRVGPGAALAPHEAAAVATHFAGEQALYLAFRDGCLAQFGVDVRTGGAALRDADAPALRRLAHSLKSVLTTLGQPQAGAVARELEAACERADWAAARPLWAELRAALSRLHAAGRRQRPPS